MDIQCYNLDGTVFIKEIAAVDIDMTFTPKLYVFKQAPSDWDKLSEKSKEIDYWLQYEFHALEWPSGNKLYRDLPYIFKELRMMGGRDEEVNFLMKGLEKKRILEPYLDYVFNLDDIGCPSAQTLGFRSQESCKYHQKCLKKNCSLQNVILLRSWYIHKFNSMLGTSRAVDRDGMEKKKLL